MKFTFVAFFILLGFQTSAQKVFQFGSSWSVSRDGQNSPMPFAGGINASQLQQIDINGNGQEELVVWDKNAATLLVFEKSGLEYIHQPYLSYYFPEDISGFLILADFDGDGRKDLFTSSPFGIKVYRNASPTGHPRWEVAQEFLRLNSKANLQMNNLDVPAIIDLDGDGDLDIVTFNFASGDFLEYYQNTSVERKGFADVDGFAAAVSRWGGFEFCSCDSFSFGLTCAGRPIAESKEVENLKVEHAGGHSLLMHDFNRDGVLDILMGQDECNSLYYLVNEGSNTVPVFKSFAKKLPQLGALPEFPIFHAAYFVDDDLVITTNSPTTASQYNADYGHNLYRYFEGASLSTRAFLQEDMVDLGENSRPFFKGTVNSGELIVTANSLVDDKTVGKAYHFTLSEGNLSLDEENFLELSTLGLLDLQYQEIRLEDNIPSLLLSGVEVINFTAVRKLYWSSSVTKPEWREIAVPEIQLRGNDQFEFYSYDGEDYLMLARQTGELIRYKINLVGIPELRLLDRNYLGFADNAANRNLSVHTVQTDREGLDLYVVDQRGVLKHLPDFINELSPNSGLLQLEDKSLTPTRLGRNTWITSVPSELGQFQDLILGNTAGGLIYLKDVSASIDPPGDEGIRLKIYPNPSTGPLNIVSSSPGTISLINTLGQMIMTDVPIQGEVLLPIYVPQLNNGVYFVQWVGTSGKRLTKKFLIKKRQ